MSDSEQNTKNEKPSTNTSESTSTTKKDTGTELWDSIKNTPTLQTVKLPEPIVAKNVKHHTIEECCTQLFTEGMMLVGKLSDTTNEFVMDAQFELIKQLIAKRDQLFAQVQRYAKDNDAFYQQVLKHNLVVKRDAGNTIKLEKV